MKTTSFLLCLVLAVSANAQVVYHDASAFPLLGKATGTTLTRYERLPDSLQNISRKPLWELGRNSAGLAVRFRSNSTRIAAKWDVLLDRNMNHMTLRVLKDLIYIVCKMESGCLPGADVRKERRMRRRW